MKSREEVEKEILEIVHRETRAWNAKDVGLRITVFHLDMVWPWPTTSDAHDPMNWLLVLERFDAARWTKVWQDLFDTHTLIHNQRAIRKIEVSDQGDGAFAVVEVDTLVARQRRQRFPLERARLQGLQPGGSEWKMTMHTGLLEY